MGRYTCTQGQYDKIIDKILRNAPGLSVHDLLARDVTLVAIREPPCTPWRTVHTASQGDVDLVVVTNADLGLTHGATLDETYRRAVDMGFLVCPKDAIDFLSVPWDRESINIGMHPVEREDGTTVGIVAVDAHRCVECTVDIVYDPNHVWPPEQKWAFVRPRA